MSSVYESFVRPLLFAMDAEKAHRLAVTGLRVLGACPPLRILATACSRRGESEPVRLFGLEFPNRIGLAAGMDKCAEFPRALVALGFGHVEVGTVTPKRQPGNPRPRLFRYPASGALVNRMGFNNDGASEMVARLARAYPRGKRSAPLGINLGKAKTTELDEAANDYLESFAILADQADYVALNVSSPNTPDLRDLQTSERLGPLLAALREANDERVTKLGRVRVPILIKVSPDESYRTLDGILEQILAHECDGVIATNTTTHRDDPGAACCRETGGLSGVPLRRRSTEVVRYLAKATGGQLPIIGVGGVDDVESAGEKLDAGASLVQIYTGLVYKGPFLAGRLARALTKRDANWV